MRLVIAALLSFTAASVGAEPPEFAPGRAVSVPWEGLRNPLVVRLPGDYSTERLWPVVFHYHGTGGEPTIDIPLRYTDGRHFVLVGMEYITRELPAVTPDYLAREWAHLLAVRDGLAKQVRIDPARVYVGGFSQGGWFASEFAEMFMKDLAGAYVLGAGKRPRNKRQPKPIALKKPVYLGAGQLDINYIYTVAGIKHFGQLGANVTFDDYLGLAHHMPMGGDQPPASSLRQWFTVEALRDKPETLRAEAAAWKDTQRRLIEAEKNVTRAWLRVTRLTRMPFFQWLPASERKFFDDHFATLEKLPELRNELASRIAYFGLVDRELTPAPNGNLWRFCREMALRYDGCWKKYPQTYHGRRAAMELARLRAQLGHLELWRFPDEETKQKALSEAAAKPLPAVPDKELSQAFRQLHRDLEAPPS
ncbi:MAG: hypothetical protein ACR2OZ_06390 [Verrucomicrobiales bacterium]